MSRPPGRDLAVAAASLTAFALLGAFAWAGALAPFDEPLLRAMRRATDPRLLTGPEWAAPAALAVTRLGDWPVLLAVVLAAALWLAFAPGRAGLALAVFVAGASGLALDPILKDLFGRERPTLVPLLAPPVRTPSFPSGHALGSSVVYLGVALALARVFPRRTGTALLAAAALLSGAVAVTRVALGVHYPSDVLAGWALGAAWAILWLRLADRLERREAGDTLAA